MGKDMEGSDRGIIESLSQNSAGGIEENAVRIGGIPAKIQTEHLPNTNLDRSNWLVRISDGTLLSGFTHFVLARTGVAATTAILLNASKFITHLSSS